MNVYFRQRRTDTTYLIGLGVTLIFHLGILLFLVLTLDGDLQQIAAGVLLLTLVLDVVLMGILSQRVTVITQQHLEHGTGLFRRRYPLHEVRDQHYGQEIEITLVSGHKVYIVANDPGAFQQALAQALEDYGKNIEHPPA